MNDFVSLFGFPAVRRSASRASRILPQVVFLAAGLSFVLLASAADTRVVEGTRFADVIDESGADVAVEIYGLNGKDTITGSAFADIIDGGRHNDIMSGGNGDDVFAVAGTQGGIDIFSGGSGIDRIQGASGNDSIGINRVFGGNQSVEVIDGGSGRNEIVGTSFGDDLDFSGTTLINISLISGGKGDDSLVGSNGADTIAGGSGRDTVYGGAGNDTFLFEGLAGDFDIVRGGAGADRIVGTAGDDLIGLRGYSGANSVELIDGGGGFDAIAGSDFADLLDFSATILQGIALIDGRGGNDAIVGSELDDVITGGAGNDTINGGAGFDTAVFEGAKADYEIFISAGSTTVIRIVAGGANESDILIAVEEARFSDVSVPIGSGNQSPIAVDDTLAGREDTEAVFPPALLLGNDSDPDGDTLTLVSVTAILGAQVSILGDGDVKFTPDQNFNGEAVFSYVVEDGNGGTRSARVSVEVEAVNDEPLARNDSYIAEKDRQFSFNASLLLENDEDIDGDELGVLTVDNAVSGSVELSAGQIRFQPDSGFEGQARFRYQITDNAGGSDRALVYIDFRGSNGVPVAADDSADVTEDDVLSLLPGQLLANDEDPDGDEIDIVDVKQPVNGTVDWSPGGSILFRPLSDFSGPASFTYVISDGTSQAEAQVSIDVTPVNDPPVAVPDSFSGNMNTQIVFDPGQLLGNDTDVDGDPLGIRGVGGAVHCSVRINGFGKVVFEPTEDFQGVATFNYTIEDGSGGESVAIVTVNVGFSFRVLANNKSTSILQWDGATGEFLGELVQRPSDTKQPHSVTIGPDGNIYVGWTGGSKAPASVRSHNPITGEQIGIFATFEMESDDTGDLLSALAFAPNGQLLVADNIGRDPERKMFRFQGLSEPNPGAFVDEFIGVEEYQGGTFKVYDFDFDRNDNLLIPSAAKHEIIVFEGPVIGGPKSRILDIFVSAFCYEDRDDGIFTRRFGCYADPNETGFNAQTMTEGYGLAWGPDGNLYVAVRDAPERYGRIMYFTPDGEYLGDWVTTAEYSALSTSQPRDIDFGPDGNLYVTNQTDGKVLVFGSPTGSRSGDHVGTLTAPGWVKFNGATSIEFVLDE